MARALLTIAPETVRTRWEPLFARETSPSPVVPIDLAEGYGPNAPAPTLSGIEVPLPPRRDRTPVAPVAKTAPAVEEPAAEVSRRKSARHAGASSVAQAPRARAHGHRRAPCRGALRPRREGSPSHARPRARAAAARHPPRACGHRRACDPGRPLSPRCDARCRRPRDASAPRATDRGDPDSKGLDTAKPPLRPRRALSQRRVPPRAAPRAARTPCREAVMTRTAHPHRRSSRSRSHRSRARRRSA